MSLPDAPPVELDVYDTLAEERDTIALHGDDIESALEDLVTDWPDNTELVDLAINAGDVDGNKVDAVIGYADIPIASSVDTAPTVERDKETVQNTAGETSTPTAVCQQCGETHDDGACWDESTEPQNDRRDPTPADVLRENADLYAEKNDDYGDSWRLVGETIALWSDELDVDSVDLSDPEQAAMLGLYWERLIKLVRGFNLEFSNQSPNNESTEESHADASTYAAMAAVLADEMEEN